MDDTTHELALRLRDLGRLIRLIKQHRGGDRSGVPAGILGVLTHIDEFAAGCNARELADRTGLDPSTISRAVGSLVAHGLVERRADPADGRVSVLALTVDGRAALADAHRWSAEVLTRALADWAPGEVAALCAALGRFTHDIERSLGHPDPRPPDTEDHDTEDHDTEDHDTLEAAR